MSPSNHRSWSVLFVLFLAFALSTCGGSPSPTPAPPTPLPPAATEAPMPALTLTLTATPTPEPQQPAASTPAPTATSEPQEPVVPTPTFTPMPMGGPTPTVAMSSRCAGLAGQLEVQILVGPADAVGLEPVAVGNVPFAVTTSEAPFLVEGQGPISYEATLQKEWGTYAVTMDMDASATGQCSGEAGGEQLDLVLEMTGEQLVVVESEGFSGEYPWSGTQSRDLAFPLEEGATAQGEGWAVVLHLNTP